MTIVIDGSSLQTEYKSRGIGRYTRNLVDGLKKLGTEHKIILTSRVEAVKEADLVHYPYFDLFHRHLPFLPPVKREVVTIHDLIPLRFPQSYRLGVRSGCNLWLQKRLIKRVGAVIADSAWSAQDIQELLPGVSSKVSVVPLGVETEFGVLPKAKIDRVRSKYGLPQKYILYVGDVTVNKNLPVLIKAIWGIRDFGLVMVTKGMLKKDIPEVKAVISAVEKFGMGDRVYYLSSVRFDPGDDLVGIYNGAGVYIQPSLYEGFGLPVLEAMACGTPVVAANVTSLPEVAGGAAFLADPTAEGLRTAVKKLLWDDKLRRELITKGKARAAAATWEKTARETLRVYENLL
jgi:glycosyltransferase involved in cell wall biosynthesis